MKIKFFFIIWCLSLLTVLEAQGENVTFRVRSWDAKNNQVVTTTDTKDATVLSGEHENDWIALGNGYYVVNSHTQYKVLNITGNDVHLILSNGAEQKPVKENMAMVPIQLPTAFITQQQASAPAVPKMVLWAASMYTAERSKSTKAD